MSPDIQTLIHQERVREHRCTNCARHALILAIATALALLIAQALP